jgi:hypothetical protein
VVLKRLDDINAVYSHYCFMAQNYVICMFVVVELWTEL